MASSSQSSSLSDTPSQFDADLAPNFNPRAKHTSTDMPARKSIKDGGRGNDNDGLPHRSDGAMSPDGQTETDVPIREDQRLSRTSTDDTEPRPRSSRRRAAPPRLTEEREVSTKKVADRKVAQKNEPIQRGSRKTVWSPDRLLQDPKSKLAKIDLMALLCDDRAWTALSLEQQTKLLSLIPGAPTIEERSDEALPNIPKQMLKANSAFQADVRMFQDDLSSGRLVPEWQRKAHAAMEMRARGDFDEWKHSNVEQFWGQKQKLQYTVLAGESSKVKLETLVHAGCIRVGDVWTYYRGFGKGKNVTRVEKEAKVEAISANSHLSFSFPPGQYKFSSHSTGEDIRTDFLGGPQALATAILREDGRYPNVPNVNAWKEFRCFRSNQDIGSLWEIRETFYQRHSS